MTTFAKRNSWRAHAVLAASAAAALIGTVSVGQAAIPTEERSVTVHYRDLNLATEQGNTTLYQRIVSAAQEVCGEPDLRDFAAVAAAKACEANAIERAVAAVNSPKLAAIYSARVRHG